MSDSNTQEPTNPAAGLSEPDSVNNGSATPQSPAADGVAPESHSYQIADVEKDSQYDI